MQEQQSHVLCDYMCFKMCSITNICACNCRLSCKTIEKLVFRLFSIFGKPTNGEVNAFSLVNGLLGVWKSSTSCPPIEVLFKLF